MIVGKIWEMHDSAALGKLDSAAVRLLRDSGCRIDHEGLLDMMEAAGCIITRNNNRCYMPESLVRKVVAAIGKKEIADSVNIPTGWNPQRRLWHGGTYPHILDWPSGERRLATKQDIADMAKMAHVLDEFERVGRVLCCHEIPQQIEPLWTTLELAGITTKPIGGGEIFYPGYIEPLVRMGEVLSGKPNDTSLIAACDFFIAPLIFDRTQAECFLEKRRFGIQNMPGTMPISGLSSPVTVAGTAALALAELLAGWVFGYVVNPELPAGGIVATGSLDMRLATPCFGSPEALLQDTVVVQTCRRLYNINIWAANGYVDCKRPGLEAVFQKMLPLVAAPLESGPSLDCSGLLSAGQDYSPVQQMLDTEIEDAIARFRGAFDVTPETLAVELMEEMMKKPTVNFTETEHTLEHFRLEQWYPRWFDRTLWRGRETEMQAEMEMFKRIDDYCKKAIAAYEPPDIDQAKIRELRRILQRAEKTC